MLVFLEESLLRHPQPQHLHRHQMSIQLSVHLVQLLPALIYLLGYLIELLWTNFNRRHRPSAHLLYENNRLAEVSTTRHAPTFLFLPQYQI